MLPRCECRHFPPVHLHALTADDNLDFSFNVQSMKERERSEVNARAQKMLIAEPNVL